jgi:hypothetical protein
MSSIGSAPRQIPVGLQYYPVYQATADDIAKVAYVFIPDSGNYVGNYPPGFVVPMDEVANVQGSIAALGPVAAGLPYNFLNNLNGKKGTFVLRDMGKTIFADVHDKFAVPTNTKGYFREVQVLIPQPISTTQGFLGGVNGSVFGVYGSAPQYAPYATIYFPTNVDGVLNTQFGNGLLQDPTPQSQM